MTPFYVQITTIIHGLTEGNHLAFHPKDKYFSNFGCKRPSSPWIRDRTEIIQKVESFVSTHFIVNRDKEELNSLLDRRIKELNSSLYGFLSLLRWIFGTYKPLQQERTALLKLQETLENPVPSPLPPFPRIFRPPSHTTTTTTPPAPPPPPCSSSIPRNERPRKGLVRRLFSPLSHIKPQTPQSISPSPKPPRFASASCQTSRPNTPIVENQSPPPPPVGSSRTSPEPPPPTPPLAPPIDSSPESLPLFPGEPEPPSFSLEFQNLNSEEIELQIEAIEKYLRDSKEISSSIKETVNEWEDLQRKLAFNEAKRNEKKLYQEHLQELINALEKADKEQGICKLKSGNDIFYFYSEEKLKSRIERHKQIEEEHPKKIFALEEQLGALREKVLNNNSKINLSSNEHQEIEKLEGELEKLKALPQFDLAILKNCFKTDVAIEQLKEELRSSQKALKFDDKELQAGYEKLQPLIKEWGGYERLHKKLESFENWTHALHKRTRHLAKPKTSKKITSLGNSPQPKPVSKFVAEFPDLTSLQNPRSFPLKVEMDLGQRRKRIEGEDGDEWEEANTPPARSLLSQLTIVRG